jgi:hypothetical protein
MNLSKRKIKKLRKKNDPTAPLPNVGIGHVTYSGAGIHHDKREKKLKKARRKDENDD